MNLTPCSAIATKKAMQIPINTLFILFRMSKCQKNKYFIASSCGTQGSANKTDKTFQQDLSKLMATRDAQDSKFQVPLETAIVVKANQPKESKPADIDLILAGDY